MLRSLFIPLVLSLGLTALAPAQPASAPASSPVEELYNRLRLTDRDRQILTSVRDGRKTPESTGWYLMLDRTARLPDVPRQAWDRVDAPAAENLLRSPDRYRYQPLRLNVLVYAVEELTIENGKITASPYWPADKPVWVLYCTADQPSADDPPSLLVYTTQPPNLLGEPNQTEPDGKKLYTSGQRIELLGVFFCLVRQPSRGDDQQGPTPTNYPVVLAWQLRRTSLLVGSSWQDYSLAGILGAVIVLLVVGFVMAKKKIRRERNTSDAGRLFGNYKPLREEEPVEPLEGPVDPDLVSAVEQSHSREHPGEKDPPDHAR